MVGLNPAQKRAVEHQNGPLLVLAGAGSGKTRVITQRMVRMMERGVPASTIVALTFTNKAAAEMGERVAKLLGKNKAGAKGLTISTFHSFGLHVLTREKRAQNQAFTIFDQGDALGTVKEILRNIDAGKRFDVPAIMSRISNAKNAFLLPEELPDDGVDPYNEITKIVYPRYQAALRTYSAYDFDDLVCEVVRVWQSRPDVLARWQEKVRYLLVDEYQDTNRAQLMMLRLLAEPHRNICVVGDDDQAIYGWRGADVRNILEFEEHFTGAEVVKLEQNYRSKQAILDVANAVIGKRVGVRHKKHLFSERVGDEKITVASAPTPEAEASYVVREISRWIRDEKKQPRDLSVLYRSNSQAKLIEESLRSEGIAYRIVGGQQFFERKEVKDVLSYLKLALNRSDEISLRRIMNYPARGIGDTSVERLALHAQAKGWTLWQGIERVDAFDDISEPARQGCKQLERIVGDLRRKILVEQVRASEVASFLCQQIGLRQEIDSSSPTPQAAAKRWGNVEGLMGTLTRREAKVGTEQANDLANFLHALTLDFGKEEDAEPNAVTLSTLHGAKGLEFEIVYLIGCEEGFLPHARTLEDRATDAPALPDDGSNSAKAADIEEERRLFYVGVTRARDFLTLSRCKNRAMRGKPVPRTPSRFLMDLPPERIVEIEVRDEPTMGTKAGLEKANALLAMLEGLGQ
ncbi:ATP-dependent helicase [Pendulispora albinea]|uniref:DNA 3'-5' helicase n=1 Tax=Pendulispora albinea TaxID=2741071 RepID=A0ABZ2LN86_9BACT